VVFDIIQKVGWAMAVMPIAGNGDAESTKQTGEKATETFYQLNTIGEFHISSSPGRTGKRDAKFVIPVNVDKQGI
jgi:hypothetical protein